MTTAALAPPVARREPPIRDYLSWSAVSTYLKCPLRYQFRYVDQVPEEFISASLMFGGAIHAAIQAHFQEHLATGEGLPLEGLLAAYHEFWMDVDLTRVEFSRADDLLRLSTLAEKVLTAFSGSDLSRPGGTVLGIEEELRASVIPSCPDLLARLDLLVETDVALVVTDFKTSRSRWSEADVDAAAGQLLVYQDVVQTFATKPVRLQFVVLTKTREPQVEVHSVPAHPQRILRNRRLIQRVWQAIQAGHFYPSPSAMHCPTCPFRCHCRSWTG